MKKFSAIALILIFYLTSFNTANSQVRNIVEKDGLSGFYLKIPFLVSPNTNVVINSKWKGIPYRATCNEEILQTEFSLKGKIFMRTTLNEDIVYDIYSFDRDMGYSRKTLYSNNSTLITYGKYQMCNSEIVFMETTQNFKKINKAFIFEWVKDNEFNLYRGKDSDNYILEKVL